MKKRSYSSSRKAAIKSLVALLLILAGMLLLARNMEWISDTWFRLLVSWKMLLVVIGIFTMFRRHYFSGLAFFLIGCCFLLPDFHGFPASVSRLMWPSILILIGLWFFIKRGSGPHSGNRFKTAENAQYRSEDGFYRFENKFSGIRQVILDEVFKGAFVRNFFGGAIIDLRHTHLAPGETYIDVHSRFGGVQIYVPFHWKIDVAVNAFVGGCEDKRIPYKTTDPNRVLVIRGNLSFSGIEIKN